MRQIRRFFVVVVLLTLSCCGGGSGGSEGSGEDLAGGGDAGDVTASDAGPGQDSLPGDAVPGVDTEPGDVPEEDIIPGQVTTVTTEQPEVPLPDPETYEFVDTVSFLSRLQVPPLSDVEGCCFDFSGDGVADNRAAEFLDMLFTVLDPQTDLDLTNSIQESIDLDRTSYIFEFRTLSEDGTAAEFSIWPSEGDLDFDGLTDQTPEERYAGDGIFQINPVGFTEYAPVSQFTVASFEEGELAAYGGRFTLRLAMRGGDYLPIQIDKFSLEGHLEITEKGVATKDVVAGAPQQLTGLRGGGVVNLPALLNHLAAVAPTCACAGADPDQPVIEYELKAGVLSAECVQDVVEAAEQNCHSDEQGFICGQLDQICLGLPILGLLADASTGDLGSDGEPGLDAISFGGFFSLSPATLVVPPVAPDFQAVDDHFEVSHHIAGARLDVLGNDINALGPAATIVSVTQPEEGEVSIIADGAALSYAPVWEGFGEQVFQYTVEQGDATSNATVVVDVPVPEGMDIIAVDDDRTILLKRGPQHVDGLLDNDICSPEKLPFLVVGDGQSWQNAYVAVAPDRRGLMVQPLEEWQDGDTTTIGYSVNTGQGPNMYFSSADVNVTYKDPEVVCGDGWVDDWGGEECDPGLDGEDAQCGADCKLTNCEGFTPDLHFLDGDDDGYGDDSTRFWSCDVETGTVSIGGDCDDTNGDVYPNQPEICGDGLNNGCRITYDCGSDNCVMEHPCAEVDCGNGLDDDGDGFADCDDSQCEQSVDCTEQDCGDGIDDDEDGLTDCDDLFDCAWKAPCAEEFCEDEADDDGDDLVDCDDPDCQWDWACREQNCGDDIDNDEDGLTDCDDVEDCQWDWEFCQEHDCDDGIDNDEDGQTDCDDLDCNWDSACQ